MEEEWRDGNLIVARLLNLNLESKLSNKGGRGKSK